MMLIFCFVGISAGLIAKLKTMLKLTSTNLKIDSILSINNHIHGNGNEERDTTAPK